MVLVEEADCQRKQVGIELHDGYGEVRSVRGWAKKWCVCSTCSFEERCSISST